MTEFSTDNATFHLEVRHLKRHANYCIEVAVFNRKGLGALPKGYYAHTCKVVFCSVILRKKNVISSGIQVPMMNIFLQKFVTPYQTLKALASCYGARQIFARRENWQIF